MLERAVGLVPTQVQILSGALNVIIKKSKIHGKGVFANRDFRKGETVIKWDLSAILTKEEVDKLPKKEKRYASILKDDKYILHQTPARYVNHSCDPNTYTKNTKDVASRDISKGEEITTDYSFEVPGLYMKCNCGTKKCRGIVKSRI